MQNLEEAIIHLGKDIFSGIRNEKESMFDKTYWLGRMMDWVMKDPSFKIDLFRFVDVLPVLSDKDAIAKHLEEYLMKKDRDLPLVMGTALKAASFSFARGMAATAIKKNVEEMASKFILGEHITAAQKQLKKLESQGFCFTIDLLGEKTLNHQEADDYFDRYNALIKELPKIMASNDPPNISIKVSALCPTLKEEDPDYSIREAKKKVLPLIECAQNNNVFINFDMESFHSHEIVTKLFHEILLTTSHKNYPHLGIVVQAYLKDSPTHLNDLLSLAKKRGTPFSIRLVKGAYWDYEVVKAQQLGHRCPVFEEKFQTDQNYEQLSKLLLDNSEFVKPCFASHNIRSLAHAIAYAQQKNIPPQRYEIQMLYGMAEAERKVFINRGHQVRIYVPIGEMLPGMSYLVRRLLENTSQMSFVKKSHHDQENEQKLLAPPSGVVQDKKVSSSFLNASLMDFTDGNVRSQFEQHIAAVKNLFPIKVPIVINQEESKNGTIMPRFCPSEKTFKIADVSLATEDQAFRAIQYCVENAPTLAAIPLEKRAQHLHQLAHILEKDRFTLSALICWEVGKTWAEADADVAEAIDFCRYYSESALTELSAKKLGDIGGEENIISYQPRGPAVIIAPWNFPLAILCGMSVAAYVAGNPIVMKPSEQASITAYFLYQRMLSAGFYAPAVHFLPGRGEHIGRFLVAHKDIATICFTGSMEVGHEITRVANTVVPQQKHMKRVIAEMGGKNAIIVDDDADLDEAIEAILKSAFSFAGQKCSAASRIIVVGSIMEAFSKRLTGSCHTITIGNSLLPSTYMGPVIDEEAHHRLKERLLSLKNDPDIQPLFIGECGNDGFFIPPAIFAVKSPNHWLMQEELFGPLIALYHAKNLDDALTVANNTQFGLTGAFFSRSPVNIEKAKSLFNVGNLYINQKCTGALVYRQPFGGFKMSGTGLKAGGPHYLLSFVDAKVVSENTMRRGFTPEVSV